MYTYNGSRCIIEFGILAVLLDTGFALPNLSTQSHRGICLLFVKFLMGVNFLQINLLKRKVCGKKI